MIGYKYKEYLKRYSFTWILKDLFCCLRHPIQQAAVLRDWIKTKRESEFIKKIPETNSLGKVALVVPSGMVQTTKIESVLGAGLRLRGWRVKAFLKDPRIWLKAYFRIMGISSFVLKNEFSVSRLQRNESEKATAEFLRMDFDFPTVKSWQYRGISIGPTLLSNIQRRNRMGSPDLSDPWVVDQLQAQLPVILEWVHVCEMMLEAVKPDLIYLIEANAWNRPLVELAVRRKIDVIQLVMPFRDDALVFKRLNRKTIGIHPNSICADTLGHIACQQWTEEHEAELNQEFSDRYGGRWFLQNRNQPNTMPKTKAKIHEQLDLDPKKKMAVVFSHILWDANLFYGEDLFEDYSDWFRQTVRAAMDNPRLNWGIKLHPANIWKRSYENETGELAEITVLKQNDLWPLPCHVRLLLPDTEISTLSLYKAIDYGITVRGTSGLELPCFGVTTLTAGTGRYAGLGFTLDSSTAENYLANLAELETLPPMSEKQIELAKWHAYAIFRLRPWEFGSFKSIFGELKNNNPLALNIELTCRSIEEITQNGDLGCYADWVEDTRRPVDYLAREI